jgi:hypothetical protein
VFAPAVVLCSQRHACRALDDIALNHRTQGSERQPWKTDRSCEITTVGSAPEILRIYRRDLRVAREVIDIERQDASDVVFQHQGDEPGVMHLAPRTEYEVTRSFQRL